MTFTIPHKMCVKRAMITWVCLFVASSVFSEGEQETAEPVIKAHEPLTLSERPVVAVLDFEYSGIPRIESVVFIDFITSHLVQSGRYKVIDKARREMLLKEIEFSYTDCADETCQLEIGRQLSADQIVLGSLGKVSNRYFLTIKLLDVETAETLNTASKMYKSMDALLDDSAQVISSFMVYEEEPDYQPILDSSTGEQSSQLSEGTRIAISATLTIVILVSLGMLIGLST